MAGARLHRRIARLERLPRPPAGGPPLDLARLSDAELDELEALHAKLTAAPWPGGRPDLSILTDGELDALERIQRKLGGDAAPAGPSSGE